MQEYINNSQQKVKVYTGGGSGEFVFLEPGESCEVDLPNDMEPRVLTVANEPDPEVQAVD